MCGIAGGVIERAEQYPAFARLAACTARRGRDGFGMAWFDPEYPHDGCKSMHNLSWKTEQEVYDGVLRFLNASEVHGVVLFASRAQPLPEAESTGERIQPYMRVNVHGYKRFALVHNGTISNDRELWASFDGMSGDHPGIDTLVVYEMLQRDEKIDTSKLVGGFAFAYLDAQTSRITLLKNTKTLWFSDKHGTLFFASEPTWLKECFVLDEEEINLRFPTDTLMAWEISEHYEAVRVDQRPIYNPKWTHVPVSDEKKAVVVTSGGIDSITAAYVAAKLHGMDVTLLNFAYGQIGQGPERMASAHFASKEGWNYAAVDMQQLGAFGGSPLTDSGIALPLGMRSAESTLCWVPGRNMVMLAYAAAYAEAVGAKWLYYGNNMEEEATAYGDNDYEFVHLFNQLLRLGTLRGVQIKTALARLMKAEILHLGAYLGVDYAKTWSCDIAETGMIGVHNIGGNGLQPAYRPCGRCGCCTTRRYAFMRAGIQDPQEPLYVHPLPDAYPWSGASTFDIQQILGRIE